MTILWKRPIKDRPWNETYKYSSLGGDITLYVIFIDTSCAITQTERMTDRQTNRQINRQINRQTNRQINRQTNRQNYTTEQHELTKIIIYMREKRTIKCNSKHSVLLIVLLLWFLELVGIQILIRKVRYLGIRQCSTNWCTTSKLSLL